MKRKLVASSAPNHFTSPFSTRPSNPPTTLSSRLSSSQPLSAPSTGTENDEAQGTKRRRVDDSTDAGQEGSGESAMIVQQAIRESSMLDERRGSSQGVMGGKRESWFQMKREEKKREQQNTKKGLTRTLRIMAPSTLYNPPPPRPNYRYPLPPSLHPATAYPLAIVSSLPSSRQPKSGPIVEPQHDATSKSKRRSRSSRGPSKETKAVGRSKVRSAVASPLSVAGTPCGKGKEGKKVKVLMAVHPVPDSLFASHLL